MGLTDEQWAQIEEREGCFPSDSKSTSVLSRVNASWVKSSRIGDQYIDQYLRLLQWQMREVLAKVLDKSWKSLMRETPMKQHQQLQQQQPQFSENQPAPEKKEKKSDNKPSSGKKAVELHFDGTGDVKAFLENALAASSDRTDSKKAMFICSKLKGKAYDAFRKVP